MFELFQMWALVEVLGLICLPLTVTVFHNLPDRGWTFSKAIGMALLAFCVWFPLMCIHALPFNQLFIAVIALILLVLGLYGLKRTYQEIVKLIRRNVLYIVIVELLFLGMVFLLGWLRSFNPALNINEMFMDEGFISAIMRSPHFPPNDMWLSGYGINYYYYAHYMIAMLAKLLGQPSYIAFNTGISIFFGLTAVNLFGVTCNIVAWSRHLRKSKQVNPDAELERPDLVMPPLLPTLPYGVLTIMMALIMGNLASTQAWFKNHGNPVTSYDWYNVSRVVPNTINEFPAFSFLLSCFHAHVLTLGFTILAIGLALNLFLESDGKGLQAFGRGWRLPLNLGVTALIIGALFTMNGWDYPTYMGLALVCIAAQQWLAHGSRLHRAVVRDIVVPAICLIALSLALFLPFWLGFVSPSQGIGMVAASDRSPLPDELLIYGIFAFVFLSLLLTSVLKRPLFERGPLFPTAVSSENESVGDEDVEQVADESVDDETAVRKIDLEPVTFFTSSLLLVGVGVYLVLCLMLLLLVPNSTTFVFSLSITVLGIVLLCYNIGDRTHAFTLFLGSLAFLLIAGCEIFFLRDVFADQVPRMNTVFKFYFQAWALLSIAGGAGVFFILESFRPIEFTAPLLLKGVRNSAFVIWSLLALVMLLAGLAYPLNAPYARYARINPATQQPYYARTNSLDGLAFMQNSAAYPGDYAAIEWLNTNIQGAPVIVEAVGGEYSQFGRISVFTGLPTPVQWPGHEYQWRVTWLKNSAHDLDFSRREGDVTTIYTDARPDVVLSMMARYHAEYLYVGPLEYAKYPGANLHRFSTFMQTVYSADGVTIYKVK